MKVLKVYPIGEKQTKPLFYNFNINNNNNNNKVLQNIATVLETK